jgi:FSR family fosmidomycin resistance protein-like MFS transporter
LTERAPKSDITKLAFTSLGHFANDGMLFFVPLVVDIIVQQRKVAPLYTSLILTLFYASSAIFSTFAGRIADKTGKAARLLSLGIFVLSLGVLGFDIALSETNEQILIALSMLSSVIAGIGSSFYHPLGASILQRSFSSRFRGFALGLNGSIGSLGRALYPILFFTLSTFLMEKGALLFFALLGVAISFVIFVGLSESKIETNKAKSQKRVVSTALLVLLAITVARSATVQGMTAWLPTFLSTKVGLSTKLGFLLTTTYVTPIVGQIIFGRLMDKFDKRLVLTLASFGSGCSMLLFVTYSFGAFGYIELALFGFFTYNAFPILLSLTSEYTPREAYAFGNALIWGVGSTGGSVIGPLLVGAIILGSYSRLGFAFEVLSIATILVGVLPILLPKTH